MHMIAARWFPVIMVASDIVKAGLAPLLVASCFPPRRRTCIIHVRRRPSCRANEAILAELGCLPVQLQLLLKFPQFASIRFVGNLLYAWLLQHVLCAASLWSGSAQLASFQIQFQQKSKIVS